MKGKEEMWEGTAHWTLCLGRERALWKSDSLYSLLLSFSFSDGFESLALSHLLQGGASTINEMCLVFFFYYPRINISSCLGYPDIIYVTNELGEEASEWVILEAKTHKCGKGT